MSSEKGITSDSPKEPTNECSCSKENPNCIYYTNGKGLVWARGIFIVIIFLCTLFAWWRYDDTNKKFVESYDLIAKQHNDFCRNIVSFQNTIVPDDSLLLVDNSILLAIKEENTAITNLMELQYQRICDDYNGLTLWASVLMILFLVFSIYSTYKIDEIQKQGRDSLSKIYDLLNQSHTQFAEIEKWFRTERDKIIGKTNAKITKLEGSVTTIQSSCESQEKKTKKFIESLKTEKSTLSSEIESLKEIIKTRKLELDSNAESVLAKFRTNLGTINADSVREFRESLDGEIKQFNETIQQILINEKTQVENSKKSEAKFDNLLDKIEKTADININEEENESVDSTETK